MRQSVSTKDRAFLPGVPRGLLFAGLVALVVVMLDLLTKWLVTRELGPGDERSSISVLGNFVELHYAQNGGVAFGLLSGSSTLAGVLVGIVIVPLLVVLMILSSRGLPWAIASGLVLGGAVGNLVDRLGDETVTDFISVGRWPSFNVADSAITVGALLLIGLSFREREQGERSAETG